MKTRLLIVGCGNTGLHVLDQLAGRFRVYALTSRPERAAELRAHGAVPLVGDLDRPATLARLRGLADRILVLAPPPGEGDTDPRSEALAALLRRPGPRPIVANRPPVRPARGRHGPPAARTIVYASTTGVYGDVQGRRLAEWTTPRPESARARKRIAAENVWRAVAPARARQANLELPNWRATVLRIPGIYGRDRLPLERLRKGLPRLVPEDDVYTNHIEIGDLARACLAALWRGRPQRIVHAADGQDLPMGDYFDQVADAAGLPRPPRLPAAEVQATVSPAMWSFMRESRRLDNRRLREELRLVLRYPSVDDALRAWFDQDQASQTMRSARNK
jgi:nucleoside-diphosphate-sugar epimerase